MLVLLLLDLVVRYFIECAYDVFNFDIYMHHLIFIYIPKPIIYIVHTAAPNCHFRLLNVEEHKATYDNAGLDRYNSPGAGAFTPWFNRTSTAAKDIEAGSELYVDYGPSEYCLQMFNKDVANISNSLQSFIKHSLNSKLINLFPFIPRLVLITRWSI